MPNSDTSIDISERFDLTILERFKESENTKQTYEQLRGGWRKDQQCKHQGLNSIQSNHAFSKKTEDKATRACLDFHFERYFLPTMSAKQADSYLLSIKQSITFPEQLPLKMCGPLLFEMAHHQSIFSVAYCFIHQLNQQYQYNKVIILHQHSELDPRLATHKDLLSHLYDIQVDTIQLEKSLAWYKTLKEELTSNTIIFYFGDMSVKLFEGTVNNVKPSILQLTSDENTLKVECISVGAKLSNRLSAIHYYCNFDLHQGVSLELASESELSCPIDTWVFWPGLGTVYDV